MCQEVPPMMRETQKSGPKDLRPISLEELKKHSHQAAVCRCTLQETGEIKKRTDSLCVVTRCNLHVFINET